MFLESKVTEIAIGQIRGFVKPSKAERLAAFELFVELSVRVTTPSIEDNRGTLRDTLDNLTAIGDVTREILRKHGCEAAKGRNDGNITLAVVALRVYNEIILPRLVVWEPNLRDYEGTRQLADPPKQPFEWEWEWIRMPLATDDLDGMRREIRAYMDTLAAIAGTPSLTDLVVPLPPSAPIDPVRVAPLGTEHTELGVPRERMVRWFSPWEALGTLRANRGRHPGRPGARDRALGAVPCRPITIEEGEGGETWIDYVSDLGDGFDPTMAVAFQLTRPSLTLPIDRSGEMPTPPGHLPRGRLLVMGGDEVYPHSSAEGYRRQTILPYLLAAEAQLGDDKAPDVDHNDLVAIPGNHDWYGGPEHFEHVFVDADEFAGHYRTQQSERWWAVQLPKGWWLWGIDTALDNTLNDDQMAYFRQAAAALREGDRVIICSPVPFWQLRQKRPDDYFTLRSFLRTEILQRGARTPLFLSGDSHFFAHYWRVDGVTDEHHITAGGGGAFMQPTHNLPEQVPYETGAPEFKLDARWPRPVESRSLGANLGSVKDPQFRSLFAIVAILHALFAGLVTIRLGALDKVRLPAEGADAAARWVVAAWPGWPILAVLLIAMVFATAPNSRESHLVSGSKKYGLIHGVLQAGLFVAVAAFARLVGPDAWWWRFVVVPLIGGVLSTVLFVMVVRWTNRSIKANDTLAFSSAHLTRYKHFVRMRINAEGDLDAYVIGIDPVGTGWYEAMTNGQLVPPYDESGGTPKLHYVWGRSFATGKESQVLERKRTLGFGHPETLYALANLAQRQLTAHLKDGDPVALSEAIDNLHSVVEGAEVTHGATHRTTVTYQEYLADALIASGGADAADGRLLLAQCAVTRLDNDLLARQTAELAGTAVLPLSPETTDTFDKAVNELLLVGKPDDAKELVAHALYRVEAAPGLERGADAARLHATMAVIQLRVGTKWQARDEIDLAVATLIEVLGPEHPHSRQAIVTRARVRVAELDDPNYLRIREPAAPPMTVSNRIAELTEILNGELSGLPSTDPVTIELRQALARAHLDDGYPAGAKSWLDINDDLLARARTLTETQARLHNSQRLRPVLDAGDETILAVSLQRQIIADTETLFGICDESIEERFTLVDDLRRVGETYAQRDELLTILEHCAQIDVASYGGHPARARIALAEVFLTLHEPQQALDMLEQVRVQGTENVAWLGPPWRRGTVAALKSLGRHEDALALLRDQWARATGQVSEPAADELLLCLELAQHLEGGPPEEIIELLEPRLPAFVERFGADDYFTLEATTLLARQLGLSMVFRTSEAAAMFESCLAAVSDPAHDQHWRVWSIEEQLVENAQRGDRERGLAVARGALERADYVPGDDHHLYLCGRIALLTQDDPEHAVAAAEEFQRVVRGRRFMLWDHRVRDADYALAIALEAAADTPGHIERSLQVREDILTNALLRPQPDSEVLYFARFQVARLSGRLGDYPRAIALLEANLAESDGLAPPWFRIECEGMLATFYADGGRIDDATRLIEQTVQAAAACFSRTDPRRTEITERAEYIRSVAARGPWEPAPVAPDA